MRTALVLCFALLALGQGHAAQTDSTGGVGRVENPTIRVTVDAATGAVTVLDKRIGYTWRQAAAALGTARLPLAQRASPPRAGTSWSGPARRRSS
ncbi:MAG: hypothetical protein FJX74_13720 [Armatimonadetes bacterium]|nr:hypothetical protein [Armatimonadota bacterium]